MSGGAGADELLVLRGLVYAAGGLRILDGLDLTINRCEIHALLGVNGSGKSTLAQVIMGCETYAPEAGVMAFAGIPLNPLKIHERARLGIALAWQEPARFEGITVGRFLSIGRGGMDPAEALRMVGLDPDAYLRRALDKSLSGGERKRIELASVLALRPKLAILDEPASGIDLLSIHFMIDVIRAFKDGGASVLLITHQEDIAMTADRASQICGGRIVATGEPKTIAHDYKARACLRCDGMECGYERVA